MGLCRALMERLFTLTALLSHSSLSAGNPTWPDTLMSHESTNFYFLLHLQEIQWHGSCSIVIHPVFIFHHQNGCLDHLTQFLVNLSTTFQATNLLLQAIVTLPLSVFFFREQRLADIFHHIFCSLLPGQSPFNKKNSASPFRMSAGTAQIFHRTPLILPGMVLKLA